PAAPRLGFADLLRCLAGRAGEQLARLVARRVHDLGALALALLPVALDFGLAVLLFAAAPADLLLRLRELGLGRALRVGLDDVGELRRGTDEMQRVHTDRMPGRLDVRAAAARRLQDAQLRLQLCRVPAERLERLADGIRVIAVPPPGQVLEPREGGQRSLLSRFLCSHLCRKYAPFIG